MIFPFPSPSFHQVTSALLPPSLRKIEGILSKLSLPPLVLSRWEIGLCSFPPSFLLSGFPSQRGKCFFTSLLLVHVVERIIDVPFLPFSLFFPSWKMKVISSPLPSRARKLIGLAFPPLSESSPLHEEESRPFFLPSQVLLAFFFFALASSPPTSMIMPSAPPPPLLSSSPTE